MLRTVAEATGLWDTESIIFNRGRSVASWTFTGRVFHHAQRPVERATHSYYCFRTCIGYNLELVAFPCSTL